jgi:hypothetical protein
MFTDIEKLTMDSEFTSLSFDCFGLDIESVWDGRVRQGDVSFGRVQPLHESSINFRSSVIRVEWVGSVSVGGGEAIY